MQDRILFVDDDANILEAYQRRLQRVMHVETAPGGDEGLLKIAQQEEFAVVVADMQMPQMNGVEFLQKVKDVSPNSVRMMLTGNTDLDTAIQAVNDGNIFRFLTKPCPADLMGRALVDAINQYRLITAEKELLEKTLNGTVELLAEILSLTDPVSFGRAVQLRGLVKTLAERMGSVSLWELETAALLTQIAYVTVPQDLLEKARSDMELSETEHQVFVCLPEIGRDLLTRIPRLEKVAELVWLQNKDYDGSGYPAKTVSGDIIPLGARILHFALDLTDLEARGSTRRDAILALQGKKGCYDPKVIAAARNVFLRALDETPASLVLPVSIRHESLHVGDILMEDLNTSDNRLLIKAGETLSGTLVKRVRNYAQLVGIREPIKVKRTMPQ